MGAPLRHFDKLQRWPPLIRHTFRWLQAFRVAPSDTLDAKAPEKSPENRKQTHFRSNSIFLNVSGEEPVKKHQNMTIIIIRIVGFLIP